MLEEGLDSMSKAASMFQGGFGFGTFAAIIGGVTFGLPGAIIAAGAGAVAGAFVGLSVLKNHRVWKIFMNRQMTDNYEQLAFNVARRDYLLSTIGNARGVAARNLQHKKVQRELNATSENIRKLSQALRSDLMSLGDDIEINDHDRKFLDDFLKKGEMGIISDYVTELRNAKLLDAPSK